MNILAEQLEKYAAAGKKLEALSRIMKGIGNISTGAAKGVAKALGGPRGKYYLPAGIAGIAAATHGGPKAAKYYLERRKMNQEGYYYPYEGA